MKDTDQPKMMPGQEPYTEAEWAAVKKLMKDALDAEEEFDLDELERFADQHRE